MALKPVRCIVEHGWKIDHGGGTARPGQSLKLQPASAQAYVAMGAVRVARWWQ